ncbi:MAG: hypothetical protein R2713_21800 [Ilumatobacteraceae bacterium]
MVLLTARAVRACCTSLMDRAGDVVTRRAARRRVGRPLRRLLERGRRPRGQRAAY